MRSVFGSSASHRDTAGFVVAVITLLGPLQVSAQITFVDATVQAGVMYDHVTGPPVDLCPAADNTCIGNLLTAGATVGDYNNDGCEDLFVTRFNDTDLLFENQCDGTFVEVAAMVGITDNLQTNGPLFADVDSDGDLDLYVVTQLTNRHLLYINDGTHLTMPGARPMFTEEAVSRGAEVAVDPSRPRQGMGVSAGDYDRDGYVDLFVTEWNAEPSAVTCGATHARLLHNKGRAQPGHFEDLTDETRTLMVFGEPGTGQIPLSFSPAFPDLDQDGWPDLAVVSDGKRSQLFWNDANGRFTRGTAAAMVGTDEFGMGSAFGDYDNDGDLDWFVTSIYESGGIALRDGNRLFRNEGGRVFSDQTDGAGVRNGYWGWGAAFFDYDNDGDLDLGHTNGFPLEAAYATDPLRMWRNDLGSMLDVSANLGMTDTGDGRAFLTFDYDNDGDMDVFVTNHHGNPVLYRNDGGNNQGDWLRVRVRGTASSPFGRGTVVEATTGSVTQVRQVGVGSHFLGEGEKTAHFGFGAGFAAASGTVDLSVRFLSGRTVEMAGVLPNQIVDVVEPTVGPLSFHACVAELVDCDANGTVDVCDIAADPALDTDEDGFMDACGEPAEPEPCEQPVGCAVGVGAGDNAVGQVSWVCALLLCAWRVQRRRLRANA